MDKSILIIGNSIGCLGPLMFFGDFNTNITKIFHVSDDRNIETEYANISQFNRYLGNYGTSNYWHAVSPIAPDSPENYKRLFKYLYKAEHGVSSPSNYVPYLRPNSEEAIKKLKERIIKKNIDYKNVSGYVRQIGQESLNGKRKVFFNNLNDLEVDYIFLAINPLDCIQLLNISEDEFTLYDHIHTCFGIFEAKNNDSKLSLNMQKGLLGYSYEYETRDKNIFYLKPFYGNSENEILPLNFGKTAKEIYKDLLFSNKLGPKFSALSSKLGLRMPSKFLSIWSQSVVKRSFYFDKELQLSLPNDNYEQISNDIHPDVGLISKKSNFVIPGNHFYMKMNRKLFNEFKEKGIYFNAIYDTLDYFDGRHSSLLLSYYSYENLKSLLIN